MSRQIPHATLIELLRTRAEGERAEAGYFVRSERDGVQQTLNYRELDTQARALAMALREADAAEQRVMIMCPPGLQFISSLFGCMYAGAVAVPAFPPRASRADPRLNAMIDNAQARFVLTTTSVFARRDRFVETSPQLGDLHWLNVDQVDRGQADRWTPPDTGSQDLAFLQYTSGSTRTPRGVELTHFNLLHNLRAINRAFEIGEDDAKGVCWLPPYHDMGLIGGILQVMYIGRSTQLMPPADFIQKPIRWLRAISQLRATISGGPNFAYDHCVRKIPAAQRRGLDLSSWKVAFNGAEPIAPATLDRFVEAFQPYGFRREAFYPCYGLAESTLIVTGGRCDAVPIVRSLQSLIRSSGSSTSASPDASRKQLVGCGQPLDGYDLRIVDPKTGSVCPEGVLGEIWIHGPSVSRGYWKCPQETERVFGGQLEEAPGKLFLRTGDLGLLRDGELYVTGRLRDLIIIRGENYYPHDIEAIVDHCHPALRPHAATAFAVEQDDQQKLVLVHELKRQAGNADTAEIIAEIRKQIAAQCELEVSAIVLVRAGSIPRTSSGKLQRIESRRQFFNDELSVVARWQAPRSDAPSITERSAAVPVSDPVSGEVLPASAGPSRQEVQDWLVQRVATLLDVPRDRIRVDEPFVHYGMDSVTAVMVAAELQDWLGSDLPPTLLYDAPNIAALSAAVVADRPGEASTSVAARSTGQQRDAIALVGIGCRFPGAASPQQFWELVRDGREAMSELPPGRWSHVPSQVVTSRAGWLKDIDLFDAEFFGIAPREAVYIDPQHRQLLEVCWEALESAAMASPRLAGSNIGVFIGICNCDYSRLMVEAGHPIDAYVTMGNASSMAAHRVSYHFDLRGPSLAIDTACSSSLVAVHQACQSLLRGECHAALAGGVNLMLSPDLTVAFSQANMLSPDGRCKTFDAEANGYVRGEGCGVVVLKRLSDAVASGDPILAVIRGTAVNQDGRSNGITAPNGTAQRDLIRAAMRDADLRPDQITYLEAHGTGTVLGDPIEFNAFQDALRQGSGATPCAVGAVKTNIGHTEAAAGVASLIKMALAIQHQQIPPHPHLRELNPQISLDNSRFYIPRERRPWQVDGDLRRAGISSFGFGGTNVHVILEEPPPRSLPPGDCPPGPQLLTLSARSQRALRASAARLAAHVRSTTDDQLGHICHASRVGRGHFEHRLAVTASSVAELGEQLTAASDGKPADGLLCGKRRPESPQAVFLFTGQGAQYPGMGRWLFERLPDYRDVLQRCEAILRDDLDAPLLSIMFGEGDSADQIHQTAYAQPALFALEYALAQVLMDWGVRPAAVMGHSLGEYVAACVAGVFSLEDGLRLAAARAQMMQQLPANGSMLAVFAPPERVMPIVHPFRQTVSLAAVNGPESLVVSGLQPSLDDIRAKLAEQGIATQSLHVSHAFHSPLMEPMLHQFTRRAEAVAYHRPKIPLISNLTGNLVGTDIATAEFWSRHVRQTVRFADGMVALRDRGGDVFVEIGPAATLLGLGQSCCEPGFGTWVPTLQRGHNDWQMICKCMGCLYVAGADIAWDRFDCRAGWHVVELPTYPFQRRRYWFQSDRGQTTRPKTTAHSSKGAVDERSPKSQRWLFEPEWRICQPSRPEADVCQGAWLPSPRQIADRLRGRSEVLRRQLHLDRYRSALAEVNQVVAGYFRDALRQMGWGPGSGRALSMESLADQAAVLPRYRRLLAHMLWSLQQGGCLKCEQSRWSWQDCRNDDQAELLRQRLLKKRPECRAELELAGRCGRQLTDVMTGKTEALAVLFPDGSTADVEALYQDSPYARFYNALVRDALEACQLSLPDHRTLNVLEIGAGTGGTTAYVLPVLDRRRTSYLFTDVSPLFTSAAEQKFKDYDFVRYAVLDAEQDPVKQGFQEHGFDIVLAANVVHATRDVRETLKHIRRLLASNGMLLLLEGTQPQRLLDLIFGLTEGWWRFGDTDLRPAHPLVARAVWQRLMSDSGFLSSAAIPDFAASEGPDDPQTLIFASGPKVEHRSTIATALAGEKRVDRQSGTAPLTPDSGITRAALLDAGPAQRRALLEQYLSKSVAATLGSDVEELDRDQPINNLGLDSLMAIQLKNRIESDLQTSVPIVVFLQGLSVNELIKRILDQLASAAISAASPDAAVRLEGNMPAVATAADSTHLLSDSDRQSQLAGDVQADDIDELSEGELDAVLRNLLAEESGRDGASQERSGSSRESPIS